jgi:hypothetical protein
MAQGDRPASVHVREEPSPVAEPGDLSVMDRSRAASWARQEQITRAWYGFLFDAAQMTRDTVVFVGLAGCLIFILLALMGKH